MKDRSNDPSHHERMLLPRSYISPLPGMESQAKLEVVPMPDMIEQFYDKNKKPCLISIIRVSWTRFLNGRSIVVKIYLWFI